MAGIHGSSFRVVSGGICSRMHCASCPAYACPSLSAERRRLRQPWNHFYSLTHITRSCNLRWFGGLRALNTWADFTQNSKLVPTVQTTQYAPVLYFAYFFYPNVRLIVTCCDLLIFAILHPHPYLLSLLFCLIFKQQLEPLDWQKYITIFRLIRMSVVKIIVVEQIDSKF